MQQSVAQIPGYRAITPGGLQRGDQDFELVVKTNLHYNVYVHHVNCNVFLPFFDFIFSLLYLVTFENNSVPKIVL